MSFRRTKGARKVWFKVRPGPFADEWTASRCNSDGTIHQSLWHVHAPTRREASDRARQALSTDNPNARIIRLR